MTSSIVVAPSTSDRSGLEELLELADPQRFEDHVLATGEEPVDRGPRDARRRRDVVDGDLGDAEAFATRLDGVEHPVLGRPGVVVKWHRGAVVLMVVVGTTPRHDAARRRRTGVTPRCHGVRH